MRTAWSLAQLGCIYRELGDYEKAKELNKQAFLVHKKHYGKNHIKTAWSLAQLGCIYSDLGDYEKAKELLEQAFLVYKKHYDKNHIKTARVLRSLGQICLLKNHMERAENLINKSLEVYKHNKHPEAYKALENLSELCLKKSTQAANKGKREQAQNFKKQAVGHLNQAFEIVKTHFPINSPHILRIQSKLKELKTEI